jgi:hypothetical protein
MKVVISQPRYLPALNYLQRLKHADVFVFLDNVQIQTRGWENRNKILINGKEKWLTIPVSSSKREVVFKAKIAGKDWLWKHKETVKYAYLKSPYFDEKYLEMYYENVEKVLEDTNFSYSKTLCHLVLNACKIFEIYPNIIKATKLLEKKRKNGVENLYFLAKKVKAVIYISGSNGREYGVKDYFEKGGIKVLFHDYEYPEYKQFNSNSFIPWLSFFDILFNIGYKETKKLIYQEWELNEE